MPNLSEAAKVMDMIATNEIVSFINAYFSENNPDGKRKRFPAVFSVYLSGLDHDAHFEGMGGYTSFFSDITDPQIRDIVEALKQQGEFNNKIFIITADHGHTAMPTDMTYKDTNWLSMQVDRPADTSCKLKLEFGDPETPDTSAQNAELENNNLHIWELGEVLKLMPTGEVTSEGKQYYKVLAPTEIVTANKGETTTNDSKQADIIAAFNGPMAHIYVKGLNVWNENPRPDLLEKIADFLKAAFAEGDGPIRRLASSVDVILIRRSLNSEYELYYGDISDNTKYVDAINRVKWMNNEKRSGDIVLIMKDEVDIPIGESINDYRYTTGVSCKSWHGSLNRSDSYVPFIFAYPGGNKFEIDGILKKDTVCKEDYSNCKGNWKLTDIVKEVIKEQYGTQ